MLASVPSGIACTDCSDSPNGWGFCRDGWIYGYSATSCFEVVVDQFSGKTDCSFTGVYGECDWRPSSGGPGGGGGSSDCWWTDLYGNCILTF